MPILNLTTQIKSTLETCFDLSRSIDLHQISTAKTNEKAIAGTTRGLIASGEFVTWRAKHLGVTQELTSRITKFNKPFHFRDEQEKGPFKFMVHDHLFELKNGLVIMKDVFNFASPFHILGKMADKFFLKSYLQEFLITRNNTIKEYAESDKWKLVLNGSKL